MDTIFALATAPGRAAVAIVRLSGASANAALEALAGATPRPRAASVRWLVDPVSRETLDRAMVLWMPGPKSFTGEDVVELHLHGGPAVIEGVLSALTVLGLRSAEPGEFTRRAFQNGRLDLMAAEGIADLVDAESAIQRRQALAHLDGDATKTVAGWRLDLVDALANLEAAIDFPDEDVPVEVAARAREPLEHLLDGLVAAVSDLRGDKIRDGYRVALIGAPNAGKSSLLNALLGRDVAIVTELPGTTRDVIEQPMELAGYRVLLADTAGLRKTDERIEAEGVRRAVKWAEAADLRLWVVDGSIDTEKSETASNTVRDGDILVLNKADRPGSANISPLRDYAEMRSMEVVASVAAHGSVGVDGVKASLIARLIRDLGGVGPPIVTRLRHRRLLTEAAVHIRRALGPERGAPELMAEDVRLAARALDGLTGRVDADAVLAEVFSRFCIGK